MPITANPAAEHANTAIRAYLRTLPAGRPVTEAERAEYGRLVAAWLATVGVVLAA